MRAAFAVLLVALSAPAHAQSPESTQLFEEGRALAKQGKYDEACAKFEKSLELDRAPGTLLNLGDCHEHLGHLALAWRLFDEAARQSEKGGNVERAKFARDRAQALVPKTSTVVVRLAEPSMPGLTVSIAGRAAPPAAEVREVVDPGDLTVEVTAPNAQPFRKREKAEAGLKLVIEVPSLVTITRETEPVTVRRRSRVVAAYTIGGLGVGSLGAGITMGIVARSRYNAQFENGSCVDDNGVPVCDAIGYAKQRNAVTIANIGTGFGIAGVLLISGGAVLFLTAPRDVAVIPTASAGSGGLAVVGRF